MDFVMGVWGWARTVQIVSHTHVNSDFDGLISEPCGGRGQLQT
jgi:hypothetical protein